MTVDEAAAALGMKADGVRKRIQKGQMQARRVGARLYLIPSEEVERWRELGRQRPGPKPKADDQD